MSIFLSWSGARSHRVAQAVCTWLPRAVPGAEPWLSSEMQKGATWSNTLLTGLARSTAGILCVTSEAEHDWMAFEAGALLEGAAGRRKLFLLLIDPDPVALAESPIGSLPAFRADRDGLRDLARAIAAPDRPTDEPVDEILHELEGIESAQVRDFELTFVLPEGLVRRPFSPIRDTPWLSAVQGIVDALRRDGLGIADHDFAHFRYLDVQAEEWVELPRWISSIVTDRLALVHPSHAEAWYDNAAIAARMLTSMQQTQAALDARDERVHFSAQSAFLYGYYLIQIQNPDFRQAQIAGLLTEIQKLEGLPRSWRFEIPARFLAEPDMGDLQKRLGRAPERIGALVSLGFSFSSVMNAGDYFGVSVPPDLLRRLADQFHEEMSALKPPDDVSRPIYESLEQMVRQETRDDVMKWRTAFQNAITGFLGWLRRGDAAPPSLSRS